MLCLPPYPLVGDFHKYVLDINAGIARVLIDGNLVIQGPVGAHFGAGNYSVAFGGAAGASRSVTELKYLCYSTDGSSCAPNHQSDTPEPSTGLAGILV